MDYKPSDFALMALALLIPLGLFIALLIPGGINTLFGFMGDPTLRPIVFGGGALVVFGILCYRIYSRMRPGKRTGKSASLEASEASRRARETWKKPD